MHEATIITAIHTYKEGTQECWNENAEVNV